ncbi:MAG: formylglycine-generating enzyme family protein [Gallionella sp.]|nr:formylglycine-generating enzyme family protein [Gallionella sp.]
MNTSLFRYLILAFIFTTPLAAYAATELQVACKEDDEDAEVTLDGEFKGYCPILLEVKPGTLKLRVVKKMDASHERVFEKEIQLDDGGKMKVDVVPTVQPIAAGQSQTAEQAHKSAEATMLAFKEQGVEPGNGKSFKDCQSCPEMVLIPPGSFMMGVPGSQQQRTISQVFAVGKYEVTFAEWDACAAAGGCGKYRPDDQGWGRGRQPVINVSWNDARRYVRWLSQKTGKSYRLLTEVEWEYAARAGTTTVYPWGDAIGSGNANCNGCGSQWDNKQPAPTGSFKANAFGIYDMNGNVCEWTEDCINDNCARRAARGGSWFYDALSVRSTYHTGDSTDARDLDDGFRVARELP